MAADDKQSGAPIDLSFATLEEIMAELRNRTESYVFVAHMKADDCLMMYKNGRYMEAIGMAKYAQRHLMREFEETNGLSRLGDVEDEDEGCEK